jgi:hypothetical protein
VIYIYLLINSPCGVRSGFGSDIHHPRDRCHVLAYQVEHVETTDMALNCLIRRIVVEPNEWKVMNDVKGMF